MAVVKELFKEPSRAPMSSRKKLRLWKWAHKETIPDKKMECHLIKDHQEDHHRNKSRIMKLILSHLITEKVKHLVIALYLNTLQHTLCC